MDVMDEEIDDERKARINQYGSADIYTLRRLKQELGARPTAHVEAEAILGSRIDGLVSWPIRKIFYFFLNNTRQNTHTDISSVASIFP